MRIWFLGRMSVPPASPKRVDNWREIVQTVAFNRQAKRQIIYLDQFIDDTAALAEKCCSKAAAIDVIDQAFRAYERECPLELAAPIEWAAAA